MGFRYLLSTALISCIFAAKTCTLKDPENGSVQCYDAFNVKMCEIKCNEGYTRDSNKIYACAIDNDEAIWSPKIADDKFPACVPLQNRCLDLVAPEHGIVNCEVDQNSGDNFCWVSCEEDYIFEHSTPLRGYYRCSKDEGWQPQLPDNCLPKCIEKAQKPADSANANNGILDKDSAMPASQQGYCMTWGEHHYRTFDGRMYRFGGKCDYVLATDESTFSIVLHNDKDCDGTQNCLRRVSVSVNGKTVTLAHEEETLKPIALLNDEQLTLPTTVGDMNIKRAASYILIKINTQDLRMKWDGAENVFIKVDDSLKSKLKGLCGDYDGSKFNDFDKSGDGKLANSTASEFANSWVLQGSECVASPSVNYCKMDSDAEVRKASTAIILCSAIMDSACKYVVDPQPYFDACREDVCFNSETREDVSYCNAMAAYFRECARHGVQIPWRSDTRCPANCPAGLEYRSCGCSSPATCEIQNPIIDDGDCIDGCHCPVGKLLHEGKCIEVGECPCVYGKERYETRARIQKDCNQCVCFGGKWHCTKKKCDGVCTVSTTGYTTFDGKDFSFESPCLFLLLKENSETPSYEVLMNNKDCTGQSCARSIIVKSKGHVIKLLAGGNVVINDGDDTVIPYNNDNIMVERVNNVFVKVTLENRISIMFDGKDMIRIRSPATLHNQHIGLCGVFDGKEDNEFTTSSNSVVSNPIEFAKSWSVGECADPTPLATGQCKIFAPKQPQAEKLCAILKSEQFHRCHSEVSVESVYQRCLDEFCRTGNEELVCSIISTYAMECAVSGIILDGWRESSGQCTISCPLGQEYKECGSSCRQSCASVASDFECADQCVSGCQCPKGFVLDYENKCIPAEQCPCLFNNRYYRSGDNRIFDCNVCECHKGSWFCSDNNCEDSEDCTANQLYSQCMDSQPLTCGNMHLPKSARQIINTRINCQPGCVCKPGLVLNEEGTDCVAPNKCPCFHGGRSYKEGEKYRQLCTECTCTESNWECADTKCNGQCRAYGDSHYTTFDGSNFKFQGECSYVLAQEKEGKWRVAIKNEKCGTTGTVCAKSVKFTLNYKDNSNLKEVTMIRGKPAESYIDHPHFQIASAGRWVFIQHEDVTIKWDRGTTVIVIVAESYKENLEGLCGNYDGSTQNDLVTGQGIATKNILDFGDSWRADTGCPQAASIISPCEINPERKTWASKTCGMIKDTRGIFKACHEFVDPTQYFENCEFDACACDTGNDCHCMCTAIAAYVDECNRYGVHVKWRSNKMCPMQCDGCAGYSPCTSACPKTCKNFNKYEDVECSNTCVEGCECEPGMVLDCEGNKCVPLKECICKEIDGMKFGEGDRIDHLSDECKTCYCMNKEVRCVELDCATTTPCTPATTPVCDDPIKCLIQCNCDKLCHHFESMEPMCRRSEKCIDACEHDTVDCPEGYVLKDLKTCIKRDDCSCKLPEPFNEIIRPGGSFSDYDSCKRYTCWGNKLNITDIPNCPCKCTDKNNCERERNDLWCSDKCKVSECRYNEKKKQCSIRTLDISVDELDCSAHGKDCVAREVCDDCCCYPECHCAPCKCEHEGTEYECGDEWKSKDFCETFRCDLENKKCIVNKIHTETCKEEKAPKGKYIKKIPEEGKCCPRYEITPCKICSKQDMLKCPKVDIVKCGECQQPTVKNLLAGQECCCPCEYECLDCPCPIPVAPVCKACEKTVQTTNKCGCITLSCKVVEPECDECCTLEKNDKFDQDGCPAWQCKCPDCPAPKVWKSTTNPDNLKCPIRECCTICSKCIDADANPRALSEIFSYPETSDSYDPCLQHICNPTTCEIETFCDEKPCPKAPETTKAEDAGFFYKLEKSETSCCGQWKKLPCECCDEKAQKTKCPVVEEPKCGKCELKSIVGLIDGTDCCCPCEYECVPRKCPEIKVKTCSPCQQQVAVTDECGCSNVICKPRDTPVCDKCCNLICSGTDKSNNCPIYECECPDKCPELHQQVVKKDGECPVIECCTSCCECLKDDLETVVEENDCWNEGDVCVTHCCKHKDDQCLRETTTETCQDPPVVPKDQYLRTTKDPKKCCPTYQLSKCKEPETPEQEQEFCEKVDMPECGKCKRPAVDCLVSKKVHDDLTICCVSNYTCIDCPCSLPKVPKCGCFEYIVKESDECGCDKFVCKPRESSCGECCEKTLTEKKDSEGCPIYKCICPGTCKHPLTRTVKEEDKDKKCPPIYCCGGPTATVTPLCCCTRMENGEKLQVRPPTTWTSDDKCTKFTCQELVENECTIKEEPTICPDPPAVKKNEFLRTTFTKDVCCPTYSISPCEPGTPEQQEQFCKVPEKPDCGECKQVAVDCLVATKVEKNLSICCISNYTCVACPCDIPTIPTCGCNEFVAQENDNCGCHRLVCKPRTVECPKCCTMQVTGQDDNNCDIQKCICPETTCSDDKHLHVENPDAECPIYHCCTKKPCCCKNLDGLDVRPPTCWRRADGCGKTCCVQNENEECVTDDDTDPCGPKPTPPKGKYVKTTQGECCPTYQLSECADGTPSQREEYCEKVEIPDCGKCKRPAIDCLKAVVVNELAEDGTEHGICCVLNYTCIARPCDIPTKPNCGCDQYVVVEKDEECGCDTLVCRPRTITCPECCERVISNIVDGCNVYECKCKGDTCPTVEETGVEYTKKTVTGDDECPCTYCCHNKECECEGLDGKKYKINSDWREGKNNCDHVKCVLKDSKCVKTPIEDPCKPPTCRKALNETLVKLSDCDECCQHDCYKCQPCKPVTKEEFGRHCPATHVPKCNSVCETLEVSCYGSVKDSEGVYTEHCCPVEFKCKPKDCPAVEKITCRSCEVQVEAKDECGCPCAQCVPKTPPTCPHCFVLEATAIDEENCPVYKCSRPGTKCRPGYDRVLLPDDKQLDKTKCPMYECCQKTTGEVECDYCVKEDGETSVSCRHQWVHKDNPCWNMQCICDDSCKCYNNKTITTCPPKPTPEKGQYICETKDPNVCCPQHYPCDCVCCDDKKMAKDCPKVEDPGCNKCQIKKVKALLPGYECCCPCEYECIERKCPEIKVKTCRACDVITKVVDECGCENVICKPRETPVCDPCCKLLCDGVTDDGEKCPVYKCQCDHECPEGSEEEMIDGEEGKECPRKQCCTKTCNCGEQHGIVRKHGDTWWDDEDKKCIQYKCVQTDVGCEIKVEKEEQPCGAKPEQLKGTFIKTFHDEGKCCPRYQRIDCTECTDSEMKSFCPKVEKTCDKCECKVPECLADDLEIGKNGETCCCIAQYKCITRPCDVPKIPSCSPCERVVVAKDDCNCDIFKCEPKTKTPKCNNCCTARKIDNDENGCPAWTCDCPQDLKDVECKEESTDDYEIIKESFEFSEGCLAYFCCKKPRSTSCTCEIELAGKKVYKGAGESWVHPKDPCYTQTCKRNVATNICTIDDIGPKPCDPKPTPPQGKYVKITTSKDVCCPTYQFTECKEGTPEEQEKHCKPVEVPTCDECSRPAVDCLVATPINDKDHICCVNTYTCVACPCTIPEVPVCGCHEYVHKTHDNCGCHTLTCKPRAPACAKCCTKETLEETDSNGCPIYKCVCPGTECGQGFYKQVDYITDPECPAVSCCSKPIPEECCQCEVTINGVRNKFNDGQSWDHPSDVCLKQKCVRNAETDVCTIQDTDDQRPCDSPPTAPKGKYVIKTHLETNCCPTYQISDCHEGTNEQKQEFCENVETPNCGQCARPAVACMAAVKVDDLTSICCITNYTCIDCICKIPEVPTCGCHEYLVKREDNCGCHQFDCKPRVATCGPCCTRETLDTLDSEGCEQYKCNCPVDKCEVGEIHLDKTNAQCPTTYCCTPCTDYCLDGENKQDKWKHDETRDHPTDVCKLRKCTANGVTCEIKPVDKPCTVEKPKCKDLEYLVRKENCNECCENDCWYCSPCKCCDEEEGDEKCPEIEVPDHDKQCQKLEPGKMYMHGKCCCVSEWIPITNKCPELVKDFKCKDKCEKIVQTVDNCNCPILKCEPVVPECGECCTLETITEATADSCPTYSCKCNECEKPYVKKVLDENDKCVFKCCKAPELLECIDELGDSRKPGDTWINAKNPCLTMKCHYNCTAGPLAEEECTDPPTLEKGKYLKTNEPIEGKCCKTYEVLPCECCEEGDAKKCPAPEKEEKCDKCQIKKIATLFAGDQTLSNCCCPCEIECAPRKCPEIKVKSCSPCEILVKVTDECGCDNTICKKRPDPVCGECCTLECKDFDKSTGCPVYECSCPAPCEEGDEQKILEGKGTEACPVYECCDKLCYTLPDNKPKEEGDTWFEDDGCKKYKCENYERKLISEETCTKCHETMHTIAKSKGECCDTCKCKVGDKFYSIGEEYEKDECTVCKCTIAGESCDTSTRCCKGDEIINFVTFDGHSYTNQELCEHEISRGVLDSGAEYRVNLCRSPTAVNYLSVYSKLFGSYITITKDFKLKYGKKEIDLKNDDVQTLTDIIVTRKDGIMRAVVESSSILVTFEPSKNKWSVRVGLKHKTGQEGSTTGPCGTYNDDKLDDKLDHFKDYFKDTETCECSTCDEPCKEKECKIKDKLVCTGCDCLRHKVFTEGHKVEDVEKAVKECEFKQKEQCNCDHCECLEAYASKCKKSYNLCIDYKMDTCCPPKECDKSMYYKYCGPCVKKTCSNIHTYDNAIQQGEIEMMCEDCFCPDTHVEHNGRCILPKDCPCCEITDKNGKKINKKCGDVWTSLKNDCLELKCTEECKIEEKVKDCATPKPDPVCGNDEHLCPAATYMKKCCKDTNLNKCCPCKPCEPKTCAEKFPDHTIPTCRCCEKLVHEYSDCGEDGCTCIKRSYCAPDETYEPPKQDCPSCKCESMSIDDEGCPITKCIDREVTCPACYELMSTGTESDGCPIETCHRMSKCPEGYMNIPESDDTCAAQKCCKCPDDTTTCSDKHVKEEYLTEPYGCKAYRCKCKEIRTAADCKPDQVFNGETECGCCECKTTNPPDCGPFKYLSKATSSPSNCEIWECKCRDCVEPSPCEDGLTAEDSTDECGCIVRKCPQGCQVRVDKFDHIMPEAKWRSKDKIEIKSCCGECASRSIWSSPEHSYTKQCNCCSVESYSTVDITLVHVETGEEKAHKLQVPSVCGCAATKCSTKQELSDDVKELLEEVRDETEQVLKSGLENDTFDAVKDQIESKYNDLKNVAKNIFGF